MADSHIAVVGGGIVGASIAYHLGRRTSDRVVVYDRGELASATTFRSTAMVGVAGPDPYHRMKAYGLDLYNEFFADPVGDPEYRQRGRLRVATSADGARRLERVASDSARDAGDDTDASKYANSPALYVPGGKLDERFVLPSLDTDPVDGALFRPLYGHVQDDSRTLGARELALEFVARARGTGVRFETDTDVTDVHTDGGAVTGIETDGTETVEADAVVCAAGPWNRALAAYAGLDLPTGHVLSPVFSLALADPLSHSMPMVKSHESSVGIHPKRDDRVLVTYTPSEAERRSVGDPAAVGDTAPDEFRETALRWAERLMPALADAELADEWVGVGTSTPDGYPIVGRTAVDGLMVAATMSGIQFAPAVGDIVARQLLDGERTEYYDAVSITRFDGYADRWPDDASD